MAIQPKMKAGVSFVTAVLMMHGRELHTKAMEMSPLDFAQILQTAKHHISAR
jgi:hypothetical protein